MIISVSRRTDIPAFFSDWFIQRLKEGYVYVQNPFNQKTVYNIELNPKVVDFIVFWTKNPLPMLNQLNELHKLNFNDYYFLFTLNNYATLELNLPSLHDRIETFKKLANKIGSQKVIWRYDPIIISEIYHEAYHLNNFEKISKELNGYTLICKTSFLTHYAKIKNRIKNDRLIQPDEETKINILNQFKQIASSYNISLELCSEDLEGFEDLNTGCINKSLIEDLLGCKLNLKRDKNQRNNCQCISSIDIGAYNTCNHQCTYCYANSGNIKKTVKKSMYTPLLSKEFDQSRQILLDRKIRSEKIYKTNELNLFG